MSDEFFLAGVGIIAITLISVLGAILSRRFNFKYSRLSFVSLAFYMLIGFYGTKLLDPGTAITVAILVGLYDATAGLWLSVRLRANMKLNSDQIKKITGIPAMITMAITALIFSTIGYALTQV